MASVRQNKLHTKPTANSKASNSTSSHIPVHTAASSLIPLQQWYLFPMAFHLLPFKYNTAPELVDKVPFTDKQPKFVLRWVIRKPDYHILKNVGNAGKSGSEKSWGKEIKEKKLNNIETRGSAEQSLTPCSSKQKGREGLMQKTNIHFC